MGPAIGAAYEAELYGRLGSTLARMDAESVRLDLLIESKLSDPDLDLVPTAWIYRLWKEWQDLLASLQEDLAEILVDPGSPSALWHASRDWSETVAGPVSGTVGLADPGAVNDHRLGVDGRWEGVGAAAYLKMLPAQQNALKDVTLVFVDGIRSTLSDVATGIVVFLACLLAAVAGLVTAVVAACIAVAGVVTIPVALLTLCVAAGEAGAAIAGGVYTLRSTTSSAAATLTGKAVESRYYPSGHWPPATTAPPGAPVLRVLRPPAETQPPR